MYLVSLLVITGAVFGPKLFGIVDLSLVAGAAGLVLLSPDLKRTRVPPEIVAICFFVTLIALDTIFVGLFRQLPDVYPAMRHTRALLSTVILGVVFYHVARSRLISAEQFLNAILICLLLNALAVLLQVQWPSLKSLLAGLVGFDKRFVPLRGFGLTAGYDTAGYLCVFGALLSALCAYHWKGLRYQVLLVIFLAATVFTSRTTMLLAVLTAGVTTVVFLVRGRAALKFNAVLLLSGGFAVVIFYVLPLLAATFKLLEALGIAPGGGQIEFVENFASTGFQSWFQAMWVLPERVPELLVGAGYNPLHSDLGYVKIIYMIGVIGMTLVLLTYLFMFYLCRSLVKMSQRLSGPERDGLYILGFSASLLIGVLFVLNIKNLYFFTRGYHELMIMLVAFAVGLRDWALADLNIKAGRDRADGGKLPEAAAFGAGA